MGLLGVLLNAFNLIIAFILFLLAQGEVFPPAVVFTRYMDYQSLEGDSRQGV